MALTDIQKESIYSLMFPAGNLSPSKVITLNNYISAISEAQETRIIEILEQYSLIDMDTDTIDAKGLSSDPYRTRSLLRKKLSVALRYPICEHNLVL